MKKSKIKIQYGIKSCAECEQNIRCNECVYNKQSIEYWQKEAVETVYNKVESTLAYYDDKDVFTKKYIMDTLQEIIFPKTH